MGILHGGKAAWREGIGTREKVAGREKVRILIASGHTMLNRKSCTIIHIASLLKVIGICCEVRVANAAGQNTWEFRTGKLGDPTEYSPDATDEQLLCNRS